LSKSTKLWEREQRQLSIIENRIKGNTTKTCLKELPVKNDSIIFYDAIVLLGQAGINETKKELRLVGYHVGSKKFLVATDRFDLTAEQIV